MHVGQGPGPGSLLAPMDFPPSALNLPSGGQQNLLAKCLLKLWHKLLVGVPHDFQAWVRDIDQQDSFLLLADLDICELDHLLDEEVGQ